MVKANPQRDYYKDLEISANADDSEVKKQYFKLARLYHPDRNPGRVAEYTPKFQAIQEAHEILSDPAQRRKYDEDRARLARTANAFRSNVAPRRGGAYAAYPGDYSAPPRRTQQAQNAPQNAPPRADFSSRPQPSSGAHRFANFPRPPPQSFQNANMDAQARASAWHRMNQGGKTSPGERPWDSDADTARRAAPRPTGAFGRSNTTRVPPGSARKAGFDPNATDDERQASGTSAYFTQSRFSDRPAPSPTATKPRPATSDQSNTDRLNPDPLKGFRTRTGTGAPFNEGSERKPTPYTTHSGEKTYFSSEELKRSASTRDAPSMAQEAEEPFSPQSSTSSRHRSASPPPRKNYFEHPPPNLGASFTHMGAHTARAKVNAADPRRFFHLGPDSSEESTDEQMKSATSAANTGAAPRSSGKPTTQNRPKAQPSPSWARNASQRASQPSMSTSGNIPPPASGADSGTSSPMYDDSQSSQQVWSQQWPFGPNKSSTASSKPNLPHWAYPSSVQPKTTNEKPIRPPSPISTSENIRRLQKMRDVQVPDRMQKPQSPISPNNPMFKKIPEGPLFFSNLPQWAPRHLDSCVGADDKMFNSFSLPKQKNDAALPRNQFKSKSEESINTQFAPGEWSGTFEGAQNYFAKPPTITSTRDRQSPNRGRTSEQTPTAAQSTPASATTTQAPSIPNGFSQQMPPPPPPPPPTLKTHPNMPNYPPKPAEVKFSPDDWEKMFKPPSWAYPAPTGSTSPTRASSNPPRKGSASTTARGRQGSRTTKATTTPKPAMVSEPSAEDMGAGSTTGYDGSSSSTTSGDRMDIDESPPPQVDGTTSKASTAGPRVRDVPQQPHRRDWRDAPNKASTVPPPTASQSAPASAADQGLNLDDLSKVAPLITPEAGAPGPGLSSIDTLGTNLPFNSAPSTAHPLKPSAPQKFELPLVPKAPSPPATGRMTRTQWQDYLSRFATYMRAFDKVEAQVLNHFDTRHCETNTTIVDAMSAPGGLEAWLSKVGEGRDEIGFNSYLRGVREDEAVRAHWSVIYDKHKAALEALSQVRERVESGGLVEG
ncbi:hypothetical protein NA57DRAFT_61650 [Rhizodiscina lignyota]|uniref:J domain-containing protein n=1 Tax=Rhizodiscina lignyota TaxID=1504668 RepID=A0A9P4I195_9PEZI|nr:hypothetical protein NA57DRAFT_61650 [Rhizodiscina lignyota]